MPGQNEPETVDTRATEAMYRVPAVERAFTLIRALSAEAPMTLAELVDTSPMNKSTAFSILRTLDRLEVVDYDARNRTYSLGPALMELGLLATAQHSEVETATRALTALRDELAATVVLYRRASPDEIILVEKIERADQVRITVQAGMRIPIQGGSFGRAFLAFDDAEDVASVLRDGLHRFTSKSVTRVSTFERELATVRRRGWAVDHEGFALGISTVAAPIFGADGSIVLVAAVVGLTSLVTAQIADQYGVRLREVCDDIGVSLGTTFVRRWT